MRGSSGGSPWSSSFSVLLSFLVEVLEMVLCESVKFTLCAEPINVLNETLCTKKLDVMTLQKVHIEHTANTFVTDLSSSAVTTSDWSLSEFSSSDSTMGGVDCFFRLLGAFGDLGDLDCFDLLDVGDRVLLRFLECDRVRLCVSGEVERD